MECDLPGQVAQLLGIFHCTLLIATISDEQSELRGFQVPGSDHEWIARLRGVVIAASGTGDFWGEAKL